MEKDTIGQVPTCLICNSYYDQKPVLYHESVEGTYFGNVFKLFCKLVSAASVYINDCKTEEHFDGKHPCCSECYLNLLELDKCERIIKDTKLTQERILKKLKDMIINPVSNAAIHKPCLELSWVPVRTSLVEALREHKKADQEEEEEHKHSRVVAESEVNFEMESDSERIIEADPLGFDDDTLPQNSDWDYEDEPSIDMRSPNIAILPTSNLNAGSSVHALIKPCTISLTRLKKTEHFTNSTTISKKQTRTCTKRKITNLNPERSVVAVREEGHQTEEDEYYKSTTSTAPVRKRIRKGDYFYLIDASHLFYKGVFVKLTAQKELICLAHGCSETFPGLDDYSFEAFRKHKNEKHTLYLHEMARSNSKGGSCPACGKYFNKIQFLNQHIFTKHSPPLICTICWKKFSIPATLKAHMNARTCSSESRDEDETLSDLLLPSLNEHYRCKMCPKVFQNYLNYNLHQKTHLISSQPSLKSQKCLKIKEEVEPQQESNNMKTRQRPQIFYLISEMEKILLFHRTPIQYSDTGFQCLELNCSHRVQGTGYFSFESIQEHILSSHPNPKRTRPQDESTKGFRWTCPICKANHFRSAFFLKQHLFVKHVPESKGNTRNINNNKVVCKSCWKVIRFCQYRDHTWSHKSDKERKEELAKMQMEGIQMNSKFEQMILRLDRKSKRQRIVAGEFDPIPQSVVPEIGKTVCEDGVDKETLAKTSSTIIRCPRRDHFYLIGDSHLFYQGVFIKFTSNELTCQAEGCSETFPGLCNSTFEAWKMHKREKHLKYLHFQSYPGKKGGSCPICSKYFNKKKLLNLHIFQEHSPPMICTFCWDRFTSLSVLKDHMAKAHDYKPANTVLTPTHSWKPSQIKIPCKLCTRTFLSNASLLNHVRNVHDNSEVPDKTSANSSERENDDELSRESIDTRTKTKAKTDSRVFFHISKTNSILLFQRTPVRYSNSGFQCLELDCSHEVAGTDYVSFQEVKNHILSSHYTGSRIQDEKMGLLRTCPICGRNDLTSAMSLRHHIFSNHVPSSKGNHNSNGNNPVVCESCWKVVGLTEHSAHTWKHKNEEEKEEEIAGGKVLPYRTRIREPKFLPKTPNKSHCQNTEYSLAESINAVQAGERFYKVGEDYLLFKGVLIKLSDSELVCQAYGCRRVISGVDYVALEKFRKHKANYHQYYLSQTTMAIESGKSASCPICWENFNKVKSLNHHILVVHSPPILCPVCWATSETPDMLTNHLKIHIDNDSSLTMSQVKLEPKKRERKPSGIVYRCKYCPKVFNHYMHRYQHMNTHQSYESRPKFMCSICGNQFLSQRARQRHVEWMHHRDTTPALECPVCKRKYHYKHSHRLRVHMRVHTGETPWICEVCGKGFHTSGFYKRHMEEMHAENRDPIQCEYCEKTYKNQKHLLKHHRKAHPEHYKKNDRCGRGGIGRKIVS